VPLNRLADEVHELKAEGDHVAAEIRSLRTEMRRRTALMAVVGAVFLALLAYVITTTYLASLRNEQAIEENNRRWCPVVVPLLAQPGDPPARDDRQQRIREAFDGLATDFGCMAAYQESIKPTPTASPTATPRPTPTHYGPTITLTPATP
jgi:hypothetical protein